MKKNPLNYEIEADSSSGHSVPGSRRYAFQNKRFLDNKSHIKDKI